MTILKQKQEHDESIVKIKSYELITCISKLISEWSIVLLLYVIARRFSGWCNLENMFLIFIYFDVIYSAYHWIIILFSNDLKNQKMYFLLLKYYKSEKLTFCNYEVILKKKNISFWDQCNKKQTVIYNPKILTQVIYQIYIKISANDRYFIFEYLGDGSYFFFL